jgi:UDP-N-acetylmuramyl pentapeptide phosphotransferase/UDP-N-acetylglucosamine-1-phosphate transferase
MIPGLVAGGAPWPLWLGVIGFAAIGAWDDLSRRPAAARLVAQLLVAVAVAVGFTQTLGSHLIWAAVGLVIIVATANATNFMDGINGITSLHAIVWGLFYVLALQTIGSDQLVPLAVALMAVGVAFLPWNMPRARMFLGDSGSYLVGASAGMIAFAGCVAGYPLAFLGPLATYASDTGWAVIQRLRRGEKLMKAHRSHVFQRLVARGWTHTQTAFITVGFTSLSATLALATLTVPSSLKPLLFVGILLVNVLYLSLPAILRERPDSSSKGAVT